LHWLIWLILGAIGGLAAACFSQDHGGWWLMPLLMLSSGFVVGVGGYFVFLLLTLASGIG
jgi:hypothetical protein